MGIYSEIIALVLSGLYGYRDFLLSIPVAGSYLAIAVQWIINVIPL